MKKRLMLLSSDRFSYQLLQPGIIPLQALEPFCLLNTHTAVLFTPAVVSAAANPDLLPDYGEGSSLAEQDFSLAELVDDLLRSVASSDHLSPFFCPVLLTLYWTPFWGAGQDEVIPTYFNSTSRLCFRQSSNVIFFV